MHEDLKDIWNSLWIAYKSFLSHKNVDVWESDVERLIERNSDSKIIKHFAENVSISWVPVIGEMKLQTVKEEE